MWGETVDPSDLHNTVWPRAAAVAEVLWTPYEVIYPTNTSTGTCVYMYACMYIYMCMYM